MPDAPPETTNLEKRVSVIITVKAVKDCPECHGTGYLDIHYKQVLIAVFKRINPECHGTGRLDTHYSTDIVRTCDCILRQVPAALADDPMLEVQVIPA